MQRGCCGLNELFENPLKDSVLSDLAANIGADVNFCLHGGTQYATSKGEKLKKISTPHLNIIIVKPKKISISAKEAYTKYGELREKPQYHNPESIIAAIEENNSEKIATLMHNVLEDAVFPEYPKVKELKQTLIDKGCLNAQMSGSGPSVFGIYDKKIDFSDLLDNNEVFEVFTVDQSFMSIHL